MTQQTDNQTGARALILVPSPEAMIQDLGPYRTGKLLLTDLLPKSALVALDRGDGLPMLTDDDQVEFAFEGNANNAQNLLRFHERVMCAAGRLATRAPSISYGKARPENLHPVASFDLLRFTFTEILDASDLEDWSGESMDSYLPDPNLKTPNSDPDFTRKLCALPMRSVASGKNGLHVWSLLDGTILTLDSMKNLVAYRKGDPGLLTLLQRAGLPDSQAILRA